MSVKQAAQLDELLARAEVLMKQAKHSAAYKPLRAGYPLAIQRLAAAANAHEKAIARRYLLRCQDGLAACHEAFGEPGPALYAAQAAVDLATVLGEPEPEITRRARYVSKLEQLSGD